LTYFFFLGSVKRTKANELTLELWNG